MAAATIFASTSSYFAAVFLTTPSLHSQQYFTGVNPRKLRTKLTSLLSSANSPIDLHISIKAQITIFCKHVNFVLDLNVHQDLNTDMNIFYFQNLLLDYFNLNIYACAPTDLKYVPRIFDFSEILSSQGDECEDDGPLVLLCHVVS
jgi:hypothetical protein